MTAAIKGVTLRVDRRIATLVFEQPCKRNAMQFQTWLALPTLVEKAELDETVGLIVLRGADGNFGAGNDIAEFAALHADPGFALTYGRAMADAMHAIEAASKPTVVAIEGVCYGASVALALAGDLRIASADATFATTPAKIGALYLRSDLQRLVAAIGAGQCKKLIYTALPIDATKARAIGLVDEVLRKGQFEQDLSLLTDRILAGSSFTLRQTKKMLQNIDHDGMTSESDESLSCFVEATQSGDFKEGVEAFLEKRAPRFSNGACF